MKANELIRVGPVGRDCDAAALVKLLMYRNSHCQVLDPLTVTLVKLVKVLLLGCIVCRECGGAAGQAAGPPGPPTALLQLSCV